MADAVQMVLALGASLGVVLAVCGVIGLLFAAIGIGMDWLNFDPQDRWEGDYQPERVKCTACDWSGPVTECFGAVFCDCPKCLEPVTSADGKEWATHE